MAEVDTGHLNLHSDSLSQQASALPNTSPQVQTGSANRPQQPASAVVLEDYNCPICLDLLLEPVVGACGHEFCKDCYTLWLARSRAYPSCPLCRKVLALAVPGVSRRLADLIEATFPEKIQLRRQAREREAATEATAVPLQGQASQLNDTELEDYEEPPFLASAADFPAVADGVMLLLQTLRHSRRPDSPYPGQGVYEGSRGIARSHASPLRSSPPPDSPASSLDPSTASSLPAEDASWSYSIPTSPAYSPTSPAYSPTSPAYPSGYGQDNHSHSIPENPSWMNDTPYTSYASLTTGIQPDLDGMSDYSPVLQPRPLPRHASVSPQRPLGGAAGIAQPPSHPPSSVTEVLEIGGTALAARQGSDDTAPAAAAAATTAEAENAHDRPQLRVAPPQTSQHPDFSRLLQSTDQLVEQLQRASERLTYLTEYAGHSSPRHGLTPPPLVTQPQMSYFPYPSATADHYARYWETSTEPLAANSPDGASAPAPAAYPSVHLNSMPYPITYSYGHDAAPAPGDSFAQSMPLPPGNSFVQTLAPSSNRFAQSTLWSPGNRFAQTTQLPSISFAQSMLPPGTLPFTMGSEPREAPGSSRRAQVAAVARNPARYRSRVPPSRSRVPPSRRRG